MTPISIQGFRAGIVDRHKYLAVHIDSRLDRSRNANASIERVKAASTF